MRRLLIRSTTATVLLTLLLVAAPITALFVWAVTRPHARRHELATALASSRVMVLLIAIAVLLVAVTVLVAALLTRREIARLTEPMDVLGHRAERLALGDPKLAPIASGIPEIDRLERALVKGAEQASRRLAAEREFAADASHQLRTPLTALLMRLEEIAATDDLKVVQEESAIAIAQVERLSGVVSSLMSRTRSGEDLPGAISLDTVLAAIQREWQPAVAVGRRSIRVTGERGLKVRATPDALAQIFSTLVENSLAHGQGTVTITCRRSGPSVVVEVSDEGPGIPASLAPHIFERRVSSSGSGLGLTLARDLAGALGGRLELIRPQGAVFALFLSAQA